MPFETRIQLRLELSQPTRIVRSEIVGESMYMGRIPVQWGARSTESKVWETEVFLGACTDPQMIWALRIQVEPIKMKPSGDNARIWLHIPFQSNWR
ncbi:hypothetical protein CWE11_01425 [Aliidiomarina sanyensis]|uniref:Uncharacterized protein n=1 Tax=Aliidiomarina sanyensis TaxID=1249555 RepID=A0A432WRT4_9GAMM|nr:hypothetical protein CWE11_01425 [Aliidiomarina sanyensis]